MYRLFNSGNIVQLFISPAQWIYDGIRLHKWQYKVKLQHTEHDTFQ